MSRPGTRWRGAFAVSCVAAFVLLAACASDDAGSAERFCGEINLHATELTNPDLAYSDDIEPLLELYRSIGDLAPLSVEKEWEQLTEAYETVSTVVPGDVESEQIALSAIFSTEKSAAAVNDWLIRNCGIDIGPVFTIVAQDG